MNNNSSDYQYKVLSPWAEVEPIQLKGLTATRVTELTKKKIGLFINDKRAAPPIMTTVEAKLKERFPNMEISRYYTQRPGGQEKGVSGFEEWVHMVDAVVLAVGD